LTAYFTSRLSVVNGCKAEELSPKRDGPKADPCTTLELIVRGVDIMELKTI